MAQIVNTLREEYYACLRMEQEKERLTRDIRDVKKVADHEQTVIATERGRVHECEEALMDVVAAVWPGADTLNDLLSAVTEKTKIRIWLHHLLQSLPPETRPRPSCRSSDQISPSGTSTTRCTDGRSSVLWCRRHEWVSASQGL